MAFSKSLIAFAVAMAVTLASVSAQNTPQDFVDRHNEARAKEGVGLGPVVWDPELARYAQNHAAKLCIAYRRDLSNGPYGENLFWGPPGRAWTAADAVGEWMSGKAYYHYDTNTCDDPGQGCLTYTQVVWRNTMRIGCGRVDCEGNRGVFMVCSYDPKGNFEGQRPY